MGNSSMTLIIIIIAIVVVILMPLLSYASEMDSKAEQLVQSATSNFVNTVRTTGILDVKDYNDFLSVLTSTGNSYNTEIILQIAEENPGKKIQEGNLIGDKVYYIEYTTQVLESILGEEEDSSDKRILKEGDFISVTVENQNITLTQQIKKFMYSIKGEEMELISANSHGMITKTGEIGESP